MTTRATLRTRVGIRTGRTNETNFAAITNEAFDTFLRLATQRHDFKAMNTTVTASLSADSYYVSLPTVSLSGYMTSIQHITSIRAIATSGSQQGFPITLKDYTWLERRFPDRTRSGSISQIPAYAARFGSTLQFQAPADSAYTLTLSVTVRPLEFAGDSTANPIEQLDDALVYYACSEIHEAIGEAAIAQRYLERAWGIWDLARASDMREPARIQQADGLDLNTPKPVRNFDLDDLQGIYPE